MTGSIAAAYELAFKRNDPRPVKRSSPIRGHAPKPSPDFDLSAHLDAASIVDARSSVPKERGNHHPGLNLRQAKPLNPRPMRAKSTPKRFGQAGLAPCEEAIARKLPQGQLPVRD